MLLSAGHLLAFVDRAKLAGAMPAIRRQIVMSDTAAGWVIGGAFALGYGFAVMLVIALPRREAAGWSWPLPAGVLLWATASLATGLAGSLGVLIASRMLVGAGQALFIPAAVSWIGGQGDRPKTRINGLARFTAAASIGRSLGLLVIALAIALVGWLGAGGAPAWRWSFVLTTIPTFLLATVLIRHQPFEPHVRSASVDVDGRLGWARPIYLVLALLPLVLTQAFAGWLPTLFVLDRDVAPQVAAGWLGLLTLVGGAGGQLIAGWLMTRIEGWRRSVPLVIVGGMLAALPGVALVGWGPGAVAATVGVLLVDVTLGLAIFAALLGWQALTPPAARVAGNAIFFALVTIVGVGLGPLLTGVVADLGTTLRGALMAMTLGCTALAAIVAVVAQPLYRRRAAA